MTLNGIAILIGMAFAAICGAICYCWGRNDERDAWKRATHRTNKSVA